MRFIKQLFLAIVLTTSLHAYQVVRLPYADTPSVLQFVKHYLSQTPVIVEAGGFDGNDTIQMAYFWRRGQIHTFEPVPELFEKIKRSAKQCSNVYVYPFALSDKNGFATFHLSVNDDNPHDISASSSLLAPKEHLKGAPFVKFPRALQVETVTLDSWAKQQKIDHIDFLWLDMQGYELHMLKASELAKQASAIWLEVEFIEAYEGQYLFHDICNWMTENHFYLAATNFNLEKPENWFADALFIKMY